jgi:hypothetical protein
MRGYNGSGQNPGAAKTVEAAVVDFDIVSVGITTGKQHSDPDHPVNVYYNYRQFAFTTQSADGSWKLWLGTVTDMAEVRHDPVATGGTGDKVALSCASLNETVNGTSPRRVLTLWREAFDIKTRSWRVADAGVTSLASAAETKPLGVGIVHGMSVTQGNDVFATVVWPGASNSTSRLQLVSVGAHGAMTIYASAVAYKTPLGLLAVAAWRFAAPGSVNAARTVLASKVGGEQPTSIRIASLLPASENDNDPVTLVTLSCNAGGALRLVSWRLHRGLASSPVGSNPIGV